MLCDDGSRVVEFILDDVRRGIRLLPAEFSLKDLEKAVGVRPQNIGMAFVDYIERPLQEQGYRATKIGNGGRKRIRLERLAGSDLGASKL